MKNTNRFAILDSSDRSKIKVQYKQEDEKPQKNIKTKISKNKEKNNEIKKVQYKQEDEKSQKNIKIKISENQEKNNETIVLSKIEKLENIESNLQTNNILQNQKNNYVDFDKNRFEKIRKDFRKKYTEQKELYIENYKESTEIGNVLYLNSPWTVWVHKLDCKVWTEDSYTNIYIIDNIGSFWRFFNNFHMLDKIKNQFFIMRNKIKPIWEDNDNRNGGICSIKIDCFSKQGKIDVGIEIMICVCLLIMNETFVQNSEEINGISYSIKNRSVLIKVWVRNFCYKITDKLPIGLFSKLDTIMRNLDKSSLMKRDENKVSIRYTQIQPEDFPQFQN